MRENLLKRIETNPKVMLGKPVIRGTCLTVELIVEKLSSGMTPEEIQKEYPFIILLKQMILEQPCFMPLDFSPLPENIQSINISNLWYLSLLDSWIFEVI